MFQNVTDQEEPSQLNKNKGSFLFLNREKTVNLTTRKPEAECHLELSNTTDTVFEHFPPRIG